MVVWSGLGSGLKALILGGAAVSTLAVAAAVWQGRPAPGPADKPEPVAAAPDPAAPAPAASTPAPSTVVAEPAATDAAAPAPPAFDVVRVEPDGAALVAGRAEAGQDVAVLIDGAQAALAQSDPQGRFVVFLTLASSAEARVMTLELRPRSGPVVQSSDQVLLAPTPPPEVPTAPAAEVMATAQPPADVAPAGAAAERELVGTDADAALVEMGRTPAEVTGAAAPSAPAQGVASLTEPALAAAPAPPQTDVATAAPALPPDPASASLQPVAPVAEAPDAPVAILLSGETARVLQSPDSAASLPGAISIDAISYTASGAVALSGRGEARAFVRLYLDNRAVLETGIGADGAWGGTLPTVAPGVYTLRADQVSAQGQVTSRFETPFQREDPVALAAAPAPAPAPSGATPAAGTDAAAPPGKVSITVQPGFTLWQIAQETYGDGMLFVRVYDANKTLIRDPDLIYPGQVFTVPQSE